VPTGIALSPLRRSPEVPVLSRSTLPELLLELPVEPEDVPLL
jgi:hypothetical protein